MTIRTNFQNKTIHLKPPPVVPHKRVNPEEGQTNKQTNKVQDQVSNHGLQMCQNQPYYTGKDIARRPEGLSPLPLLHRVGGKEVHLSIDIARIANAAQVTL